MPPPSLRWRPLLPALLAAAGFFLIAFLDLGARARGAYRLAERLERWSRFPGERDKALEDDFLRGVADLDRRRPASPDRDAALEVLRKRLETSRARPPAAEAYHAWRDVYDLWAPPETPWTRRARLMAPAARQRWREDWTARHLPFDPALLDLEPGETEGFRWVYSDPDPRAAAAALALLTTLDIPAKLRPPEPDAPGDRASRILVPEDRFWEAHEALRPLVEK